MLITGIKDKLTDKFVQFYPYQSEAVALRDFKNVFKNKNSQSILATNPEDFDVYVLGDIDETTGVITTKSTLLCHMIDLQNDPQVQ